MRKKIPTLFSVLYYLLFFLYVLLIINPELIYHYQQQGFSFSKYFLYEYLSYPGGIAEYISLLLFQLNILLVTGAILYTLLVLIINNIAGCLISEKNNIIYDLLKFLPGILIAGLLTNYSFHPVFI